MKLYTFFLASETADAENIEMTVYRKVNSFFGTYTHYDFLATIDMI